MFLCYKIFRWLTGSSLEPQYNHFAGTIMVLKAVGSHLVLTFCYQMPDKKLYTVVLGREHNLTSIEIHGVHNLLIRNGLDIVKSRKVCALNGAVSVKITNFSLWFSCFLLLYSCVSSWEDVVNLSLHNSLDTPTPTIYV